jgi:hypothetical protein
VLNGTSLNSILVNMTNSTDVQVGNNVAVNMASRANTTAYTLAMTQNKNYYILAYASPSPSDCGISFSYTDSSTSKFVLLYSMLEEIFFNNVVSKSQMYRLPAQGGELFGTGVIHVYVSSLLGSRYVVVAGHGRLAAPGSVDWMACVRQSIRLRCVALCSCVWGMIAWSEQLSLGMAGWPFHDSASISLQTGALHPSLPFSSSSNLLKCPALGSSCTSVNWTPFGSGYSIM